MPGGICSWPAMSPMVWPRVVGADNGARCSGRRSYRAASSMTTPYLGPTASLGLSAAASNSGHEFALGRGGTTVHPSNSAVVSRTSW